MCPGRLSCRVRGHRAIPVDRQEETRATCHNGGMAPRFLTLEDVQEVLNVSSQQAYSLVRSGDLPAIQVGGRGIWRVEASELELYIQRQYQASRERAQAQEPH